jgi:spore coat polysaccharide biosynthesis protein SpsF
MSTVIFVQARSTSTRMPGKCLKPMAGQPMWLYSYSSCDLVAPTYLLIPDTDKPMRASAEQYGAQILSGDEHDVLGRFKAASEQIGLSGDDRIVRVTSDCPLINPSTLLYMIFVAQSREYDYLYQTERNYLDGQDIEIFTVRTLWYVDNHTRGTDSHKHREHVIGTYIHENMSRMRDSFFEIESCRPENYLTKWFPKLSVDTEEEFNAVEKIVLDIRANVGRESEISNIPRMSDLL